MKEIYTKILELFKENRFSVLATVIKLTGSAPRGSGAKCLVLEDGSLVGTVGGGLLEARVLEGAKEVFSTRSPLRLRFLLTGTDVADTDMLCGGETEVFLEPVSPENLNNLYIFKRTLEIQRRGGAGLLVTAVDEDQWQGGQIPKMFLDRDGQKLGTVLGIEEIEDVLRQKMTSLLNQGQPCTLVCHDHQDNALELFVEPVTSAPILYVFGGGHVSLEIVPLANRVGFKVVVIDDRPEFADPEKFPDAGMVCQYPFEGVLDRLDVDESSYLVIVTRGHIHDKTVLAQCLKTEAKYIGMIGSRRKIGLIYNKLLEEGAGQEDLDRVHAPIGIDIGADTPEEIAVSIVAELIKVRAGHDTGGI